MKGPGEIRRKALSTADTLVKMSLLEERANGTTLPLLIQPAFGEVGLIDWARTHREEINTLLSQHGGILFRNFALQTVAEFEQFLQAITDKVLDYQQRSSPRTRIQGNVYTSTDYPADQEIFLHNENSYQRSWPLKIAFFCLIPALQGGETTIADCRRVLSHLDPAIVQRFLEKQVMYVRNYNTGFGLPWQTSFQTTERTVVEAYCRKTGIEFSWVNDDQLQTRQVLPALSRHPRTRELVWFNHATFFHVLTLEPAIREALLAEFPEKDLPNNSYYGDGSAIEPEVIASLQQAYRQEIIRFPWQKGDVLLLDNMLTAHGRAPFIGERKVVVSMAEPWSNDEI
jgi:alpha-ketoglutarate-dependent taurine dioxygenase